MSVGLRGKFDFYSATCKACLQDGAPSCFGQGVDDNDACCKACIVSSACDAKSSGIQPLTPGEASTAEALLSGTMFGKSAKEPWSKNTLGAAIFALAKRFDGVSKPEIRAVAMSYPNGRLKEVLVDLRRGNRNGWSWDVHESEGRIRIKNVRQQ